jgi:hypothetical protein
MDYAAGGELKQKGGRHTRTAASLLYYSRATFLSFCGLVDVLQRGPRLGRWFGIHSGAKQEHHRWLERGAAKKGVGRSAAGRDGKALNTRYQEADIPERAKCVHHCAMHDVGRPPGVSVCEIY